MNLYFIIILFVFINLKTLFIDASNDPTENQHLPDLEETYKIDDEGSKIRLNAFGGPMNKQIIEKTTIEKYNQLCWYSLGYPSIKLTKDKNKTIMFHQSETGFYINVEMLTEKQQKTLKESAKSKYNINVAEAQIKNLPLTSLMCSFKFDRSNGVETFKGYSKQINKYPLRIDFNWPSLTAKYNKTYVLNILNDENLDLYIVCDIETTIFETKSKYGQFTLNTKFIRSDISLLDITERHYKMDKELEYSKEQLK